MAGDELNDSEPYVCVLSNDLLRSLVKGEDQRIVVRRVTGGAAQSSLTLHANFTARSFVSLTALY